MADPFRIIVADPPWKFDDRLPGEMRGAERNYKCLTTKDICQLADTGHGRLTIMDREVAPDAVLFMWRVAAMQQEALDVVRAWGFGAPKAEVVWLKKTVNGRRWFGMGRILRAEHEVCLVATRGRPGVKNHSIRSTFVTEELFPNLEGLSAPFRGHSVKPEEFYKAVEALYDGPYFELFTRRQRPGWTCVGDEAGAA